MPRTSWRRCATGAARDVVLLPNDARQPAVAEQAAARAARARRPGRRSIPTRSPVQGLAAVAVHDPTRRFDDDVVAMAEAAAATRFAEIIVAEHESLTSAGICQPGDVLGLIDGEVVEIGRGVLPVALAVVDRLLGIGAELMTVLLGDDAPDRRSASSSRRHVRERAPLTEVDASTTVGQPRPSRSSSASNERCHARLDRIEDAVGGRTAKAARGGFGMRTVGELLRHYPRRHGRARRAHRPRRRCASTTRSRCSPSVTQVARWRAGRPASAR